MSATVGDKRTLSIPQFAKEFGVSLPVAYDHARRDMLPVPVIRIGRRMVLSREAVEEVLNKRKRDEIHNEAA